MPDIEKPIKYSSLTLSTIKKIKRNPDFNYKKWGEDSLLKIRKEIRDYYRRIQKGICAYCHQPISLQSANNAHIEHIAPKSLYENFIFEPKNLCVVCADCNEIKREKEIHNKCDNTIKTTPKIYPRSSGAFNIYHPHFDKWEQHIILFSGFYIDISPKGANTISICKLNRKLHEFGLDERFIENPDLFHMAHKILESGNIEKIRELLSI